jgi:hypothetical protein
MKSQENKSQKQSLPNKSQKQPLPNMEQPAVEAIEEVNEQQLECAQGGYAQARVSMDPDPTQEHPTPVRITPTPTGFYQSPPDQNKYPNGYQPNPDRHW